MYLPTLLSLLLASSLALAHGPQAGMPRLFGRQGLVDLADLPPRHAAPQGISTDNRCGPSHGNTVCPGGEFKCCSANGWCGDSEAHCSAGCQDNFGECEPGAMGPPFTPDMTCGANKPGGYRCPLSGFVCCSAYGWCGDSGTHCGEGCQVGFGTCGGTQTTTTSTSTTAPPTNTPTPPYDGTCGPANVNKQCLPNECCSPSGYCGTTKAHCNSPDCLVGFGKCDADLTPAGTNTSSIARPKNGNVPYAREFFNCVNPGQIAITYDDGPYLYTNAMLDLFNSYNAKATFFITGVNNGKGQIDTTQAYIDVIKRMHTDKHQLASHTWSHANLSSLNEWRRRDEMVKLEMALRNIAGVVPTYMRPPYSQCNAACQETMNVLGYHITSFDLDTDDYNNVTPEKIQNAKDNFAAKINPSNSANDKWLAIAHDIHQQTAANLTAYMLDRLTQKGYTAVTVGTCLGDPMANWYR